MTHPYFTDGNDVCSERFAEKPEHGGRAVAGAAARRPPRASRPSFPPTPTWTWPRSATPVLRATSSRPTGSVKRWPARYCRRRSGITGTGTGDGAVLKAAWPADGLADAGVLTSLASDGGINTVVLSSDELPSVVGRGRGRARQDRQRRRQQHVGAARQLTGSPACSARRRRPRPQASQFALTQDFLAQTAMIAAEGRKRRASLVIAPPTDWDPTPAVANALLSITKQAPWLHVDRAVRARHGKRRDCRPPRTSRRSG